MKQYAGVIIVFILFYTEHEQALNKYMKMPHKRDNEKARIEANEELYGMRKKFHQVIFNKL